MARILRFDCGRVSKSLNKDQRMGSRDGFDVCYVAQQNFQHHHDPNIHVFVWDLGLKETES